MAGPQNDGIGLRPYVDAAGAASARVDSDYRGFYPATWWLPIVGQAGAADNAVIWQSPDITGYNYHVIECTAGVVDVVASVDGTNFNAAPVAVLLADSTTPGTLSVTIAAGKIGILRGKFAKIQILQNGGVASNARGGHGVA